MENQSQHRLFVARPAYLSEWEFFVWRHKKTSNLVWHFFSLALFLGPVAALFWRPDLVWIWILLILLSIPIGSAGHYFSRDGSVRTKDFAHPNTVIFLVGIFALIATGRYFPLVERVRAKVEEARDEYWLRH